jgi:hypothetical protein
LPLPFRIRAIDSLHGQNSQVAKREMTVYALVDAAKLVGPTQRQNPPPTVFGIGCTTHQKKQKEGHQKQKMDITHSGRYFMVCPGREE